MGHGLRIADSPHHSSWLREGHLRKSCETRCIDSVIQTSSEGDWFEDLDNATLWHDKHPWCDAWPAIKCGKFFYRCSHVCSHCPCRTQACFILIRNVFNLRQIKGLNNQVMQCIKTQSSRTRGSNRLLFVSKSCCVCVYENRNLNVSPTSLTWCSEFKHPPRSMTNCATSQEIITVEKARPTQTRNK